MRKRTKEKEKVVYKIRYYDRTEPADNFLKYWRTVRFWVRSNYDLSTSDLEMLLFLYDERLFSKDDFAIYERVHSWDRKRFSRLVKAGWIRCWKTRAQRKGRAALYELSEKGRRLCSDVYKKLNGEVDFSVKPSQNKVIKDNTYSSNVYAKEMVEINQKRRELKLRRGSE